MARTRKPYRLWNRDGIFYYRLKDIPGWKSTGAKTRTDAENIVAVVLGERPQPAISRKPKANLTLCEFLQPYYKLGGCPYIAYKQSKDQRAIRQFSRSHVVRVRALIEKVICEDPIADIRLSEITSADVEAFQLRLVKALVGPRRINQSVGVLKTCLSDGIRRGLFERKITVSNIRYDEKPTGIFTVEQLKALFATVPGPFIDRQGYTFFLLLASTGARRGEAMGLRWKSIDLDSGKLQIVEALREGKELVHPKWGKTRADVQLPAIMVQRLREYRRECDHVLPGSFVFCRPDGKPYSGGWVVRQWAHMVKATGYRTDKDGHRLIVHSLRHTFNSILLQQGMTAGAVQAIIGWSSPEIQKRYSHLSAGDYRQSAEIIDRLLK